MPSHCARVPDTPEARTGSSRGALFAGVSLPLLLPVLAAAVSGTRAHWLGQSVVPDARLLGAYAALLFAASLLLYDHLWED